MGWIKVRKDKTEYLVSHEMFKSVFSSQGFEIVSDQNPTSISETSSKKGVANELHNKSTSRENKTRLSRKV